MGAVPSAAAYIDLVARHVAVLAKHVGTRINGHRIVAGWTYHDAALYMLTN